MKAKINKFIVFTVSLAVIFIAAVLWNSHSNRHEIQADTSASLAVWNDRADSKILWGQETNGVKIGIRLEMASSTENPKDSYSIWIASVSGGTHCLTFLPKAATVRNVGHLVPASHVHLSYYESADAVPESGMHEHTSEVRLSRREIEKAVRIFVNHPAGDFAGQFDIEALPPKRRSPSARIRAAVQAHYINTNYIATPWTLVVDAPLQ